MRRETAAKQQPQQPQTLPLPKTSASSQTKSARNHCLSFVLMLGSYVRPAQSPMEPNLTRRKKKIGNRRTGWKLIQQQINDPANTIRAASTLKRRTPSSHYTLLRNQPMIPSGSNGFAAKIKSIFCISPSRCLMINTATAYTEY